MSCHDIQWFSYSLSYVALCYIMLCSKQAVNVQLYCGNDLILLYLLCSLNVSSMHQGGRRMSYFPIFFARQALFNTNH